MLTFKLYDAARPWQMTFQDPATTAMNNLIDLHHDIMFFLIVISIFVAYFLFQILINFTFLANTALVPSRVTHNSLLEIIWIVIPSCILFIIAIPSFSLLYIMESRTIWNNPELTLKIIGHQWYWGYEYEINSEIELRLQSEDDLISNFSNIGGFRLLETNTKLILPVDQQIRLLITSDDVIHSWTIPSFAIKVDAVPGRLNQVFLKILRSGVYYGQCSEICGINHGFMPISVFATTDTALVDQFSIIANK